MKIIRVAPKLLIGGAFLILFFFLAKAFWLFLDYNWQVALFPYPVDYGEGPILDQVIRLSKFGNIYPAAFDSPPFRVTNYPPLYHLAQLPFAAVFGPAYWYGRFISFFSALACGILIGLTLYNLTKNRWASLTGGLVLFTLPYILHWSPFCRVDSFALMLSWAGLFYITLWPDQRRGIFLAGTFLAAAIFTRQSYGLAAPLAAFIWLLAHKPRRRAFGLALYVALLSIIIFTIITFLSNGGIFKNIVTANVNKFYWETVENYLDQIWEHLPYWIIGCGIFVAGAIWFRVKSWWLVAPYLVGACASAITIGKAGSNVNYLFEFSAALSLTSGALLASVKRAWWLNLVILIALIHQVSSIYEWTKDDYYEWIINRVKSEREGIAELLQYVDDSKGPVLADEFMGLIVLNGRELVYQPFEFKQLHLAGLWDQSTFLDQIKNQEFGIILLYDPPSWDSKGERWTPEQLQVIEDNYIVIGNFANTQIYWRY